MIPSEPEARKKMIEYMITGLLRESIENEWEANFVESVSTQFKDRGKLSDKQCEILERIYDKVCWMKFSDRDKLKFTKEFVQSLPKVIDSVTGCWLYQGYTLRGYGVICINYIDYYVSRLSIVAYLDINYFDSKIEACHKPKCPNKHCFNPDHLYAGTHAQNMNDKIITRTHQQHSKLVCPKCGNEYTTYKMKTGSRAGKTQRRCRFCYRKTRRVR